MKNRTYLLSRIWMILLMVIVLQPAILQADLVIDKKDERTWVPIRVQIVNASKFKGMTFFLRYAATGGDAEKLVEVKSGEMVAVGIDDDRKPQLIAKDGSGKVYASTAELLVEAEARNLEVEYAVQRIRIVKAENDALTYELMKMQFAKEGKKGPKFLKADVVVKPSYSFTYLLIALSCAAGLGLFFFLRSRNQSR